MYCATTLRWFWRHQAIEKNFSSIITLWDGTTAVFVASHQPKCHYRARDCRRPWYQQDNWCFWRREPRMEQKINNTISSWNEKKKKIWRLNSTNIWYRMLNTKTLPKTSTWQKIQTTLAFPIATFSIGRKCNFTQFWEKENMNHKYYSQTRCPTNLVKTTDKNSQAWKKSEDIAVPVLGRKKWRDDEM